MKYEFGVMSSRYKLEAKNEDVAFVTMVMFIGTPVPIVIYKPYNKVITTKDVLDMDNISDFISKNKEDLKKAKNSIKKLL